MTENAIKHAAIRQGRRQKSSNVIVELDAGTDMQER